MRKEGEKKSREEGTYDAGCGNVEDDGLVGGIVCYVKSLYEDGFWRFTVGDGGGNCGAERMRTRGGGGMGGRELTKNLVACIDQSGSEKKKGRKGGSQPGDGEHEGQETTSRGWRGGL